nr:MAG TPA: hypothetical protein [Caudoviricetes sp.]
MEKIIEKLPADFVIKKGEQALIIVVSSILPTVILFYLWDEHMYYDKDLIRTIILILAVSLCTYFYYWLIACMGDTLVYGFNKDDKSEIYIIISAAFMNSITVSLSILILLTIPTIYSKISYLGIVLGISLIWLILSYKESKVDDKYLKQIKYKYMEDFISQNKDICNTYNKEIDKIVKLDQKIKNTQSALKILKIEDKDTENS